MHSQMFCVFELSHMPSEQLSVIPKPKVLLSCCPLRTFKEHYHNNELYVLECFCCENEKFKLKEQFDILGI